MQTTSTIRTITIIAAFAGGIALACQSESSPDQQHCFDAEGDSTCVELHGDERPFCGAPGQSCEATPSPDGCVAELPPLECYSPCGNSTLAGDDSSCLPDGDGGDGDGDDEDDEDTGDGDGDGDDYEPSSECGDGVVEGNEECDDGNGIDDDECTNTCKHPTCGDGIIQADRGETCDDGDTHGGDGCAGNCLLPGTVIWDRSSYLPSGWGRAVAITQSGIIGMIADTPQGDRILGLTPDGDLMWNEAAPTLLSVYGAGIAVSPDGGFVVGGVVNGKGEIWEFDADGNRGGTCKAPGAGNSGFADVAVDAFGFVYGVGVFGGSGAVARYTSSSMLQWYTSIDGSPPVRNVVAAPEGGAWVLQANPGQVLRYNHSNELLWASVTMSPIGDIVANMTTDSLGNVYVVGDAAGFDRFAIARLNADGEFAWLSFHDNPMVFEAGFAIAALPISGVVVAGVTNSDGQNNEADGLLAWYGSDGMMMMDFVFDGPKNNDHDVLHGVAVGPDGNVVVVGGHMPLNGDPEPWVMKIAL